MRFAHPPHIDAVIIRNHRTVIVNDTGKDENVLLVSVPLENSPHDDHLVHEVILNHHFLATGLSDEKMKDLFINLEVDGTRMIRAVIRKVRRRMENVDFIQSIKLIYSMSLVCTVLTDVFPIFDLVNSSLPS
jgi:hypothetical protein